MPGSAEGSSGTERPPEEGEQSVRDPTQELCGRPEQSYHRIIQYSGMWQRYPEDLAPKTSGRNLI